MGSLIWGKSVEAPTGTEPVPVSVPFSTASVLAPIAPSIAAAIAPGIEV